MTERRLPVYPAQPPHSNVLFTAQWNNASQHPSPYVSSTSHYLGTPYNSSPAPVHNGVSHQAPYGTTNSPPPGGVSYQTTNYHSSAAYSAAGNPPSSQQPAYAMPNSSVSPTISAGHAQRQSHSPTHGRSRSHSQTHHPYLPPQLSHPPTSHSISQYPAQAPFPQSISMSSQYPATPTRPFSCDQCALSFNRQHDLKRHRETHTGEKPFLCNGGCGKTFTRKDALKRHQLVKQCGSSDQDDS